MRGVFASVEEALREIHAGRIVVVVDDEDRENEGDLVMAAEAATSGAINFMATHGRGLVCVALTAERLDELEIPMMVGDGSALHDTAFAVSVDLRLPGATGISAAERAATIRALADPATRPGDLARPGHVFPLRAREGGVLRRAGHTEAAVDLARLAGSNPAGVLCEIMNADGMMARLPDLAAFARRHGLALITVAALIEHRRRRERLVRRVAESALPTALGEFRALAYESMVDGREYVALVMGEVAGREGVLVRVHSQCLTGDVFGSLRCDCGEQLREAAERIAGEGCGVILYIMGQEGRGIGILHKIRAYALQDAGADTVEANRRLGFAPDLRDYGLGAQVVADLGVRSMRLMTNNPHKYAALEGHGLEIAKRIPLRAPPRPENVSYLETKRARLGHLLEEARVAPKRRAVRVGRDATEPDCSVQTPALTPPASRRESVTEGNQQR